MLTFLINDSLLMALTSLTMFSTAYSLRLFSMSPAKSQHILHLTFKMIATAPSPLPPFPTHCLESIFPPLIEMIYFANIKKQ